MLEEMFSAAREAYPKEACGLIIADGKKAKLLVCKNEHDLPLEYFRIAKADYAAARIQGEILAVFHSHPNGYAAASEADKAMSEALQLPFHIVNCPGDAYEVYTPNGYIAPLEGRPFVHGIHDCYSLLRDYYQQILNISLPNPDRADGWWNKGQNLYLDNALGAGFNVVIGNIKEHDVILMQIASPVPNHVAIYVGDQYMLHHMPKQLSRKAFLGQYYQQHIYGVYRHKSLC